MATNAWTELGELTPGQNSARSAPLDASLLVSGPPQSGKTVAALCRALRILEENPRHTVLFCAASRAGLEQLESFVAKACGGRPGSGARITVATVADEAEELHGYVGGRSPVMAPPDLVRDIVLSGFLDGAGVPFPAGRLMAEWEQVIDPLRISSASAYVKAPQVPGEAPLFETDRRSLWLVFDRARQVFEARMQLTKGALFERMATYFDQADDKPYSHVILDDADVMGIDALRFAATLVADGGYGLTVTCTAEGGQLAKLLGLGHFAATRKLDQLPVLRST